MRERNKMFFEVWYKRGTIEERRIALFHFRYMAEKFIEVCNPYKTHLFEIVPIEETA